MSVRKTADICICGGGATGFAAALLAAQAGMKVAIFAPETPVAPARTAALLDGSVTFLKQIGAWDLDRLGGANLTAMRLVDDTGSLFRAPEVTFHASEIGLDAFGRNIPNVNLIETLRACAAEIGDIEIIGEPADDIRIEEEGCVIRTGSGNALTARLVVAADGARSLAREAAGIPVRHWSYPQSALITLVTTEYPHGGVSTEFHTRSGPCTLVPLGPKRMSLVWMQSPDQADDAVRMAGSSFNELLEKRVHSIHGKMTTCADRVALPLRGLLADQMAGRRVMLVGEAAHVFPPIGAQGLNLGLRDVAAFGAVLRAFGPDPGAPAALRAYQASRKIDVASRTYAVDLFNRSLLSPLLPVHMIRSGGLSLAASLPVARKFLIRRGLRALSAPI